MAKEKEATPGHPTIEHVEDLTEREIRSLIQVTASKLATVLDTPVLYLLFPDDIVLHKDHALQVYMLLKGTSKRAKLALCIHSLGGDVASAFDIVNLCRQYTKPDGLTALVPQWSMSAATLIALGCDRLIMSKIGKLGPLDPIVWHPNRGWVPVRAITDIPRTLEQDLDAFGCKHDKLKPKEILSIKAESIIKPMSEQADPYIHAAYSRSADVARKYGEKVFLAKGIGKERSGRCLNQLITVYPIHAFELDADDLKDISTYHNVIDVVDPSEDIEDEMLDLLLTFHVLGIKCAQKNEPLNQAIIGISEPEEQHPEENGKRCVAKTKSGKRCKNRAAGESKYCGIHKKK